MDATKAIPVTSSGAARMIPISSVAERTSLSASSVRRAIARGDIAAARVGARWLVPEAEVDRLIASAS